jgi:adenylyltransferase/sulfurtransferase
MPIFPGRTACLRCFVETLPLPGSSPTCESAGVIAPIAHTIASIQTATALRILTGTLDPDGVHVVSYDAWSESFRRVAAGRPSTDCPVCAEKRYDCLNGAPLRTVTLCGRNAVQLIPGTRGDVNLAAISKTAAVFGPVQCNEFLLRCTAPPYELTLFKDGRAIVRGTEEASEARSVYSKMVGL